MSNMVTRGQGGKSRLASVGRLVVREPYAIYVHHRLARTVLEPDRRAAAGADDGVKWFGCAS
jgi:hypothetical protein